MNSFLWTVSIIAALGGAFALWSHREVLVGENKEIVKVNAATSATVAGVQKVDNEIESIPNTDKRTIERLQHGSYFPQR